jgi:hypothetical protein
MASLSATVRMYRWRTEAASEAEPATPRQSAANQDLLTSWTAQPLVIAASSSRQRSSSNAR